MAYELKSARYLAREVLRALIQPGDTAVDATMGNGYDTEILCTLTGETGHVYAFDVQEQALAETRKRLEAGGLLSRAELIRDGHEHMRDHVAGPVRAVVFNLGWLPGGDHGVTTRWETTRAALEAALEMIVPGGAAVICAYPGHGEGLRELLALREFLGALDNRTFNVLEQRFLNAGPGAPECFVIQRNEVRRKKE